VTAVAGVARKDEAGLRGAMAAEWTKLWSVRSTYWTLAATALLVVAFVLIFGLSATASKANGEVIPPTTPGDIAAQGFMLMGQFGLATLAVLLIASEYATGSILSTLQWVPRRNRMLLAKALVLAPVLMVAGSLIALLGVAAAIPSLTGDVLLPWTASEMLIDVLILGLYSPVVGVIALGLGAALRSVAGTLACTFLLLMIIPGSLSSTGVDFLMKFSNYFPAQAAQSLLGGGGEPYSVLVAVAILGAWSAASYALGLWVLRSRDAA
jgi:ABC-2 type transport system permease protein